GLCPPWGDLLSLGTAIACLSVPNRGAYGVQDRSYPHMQGGPAGAAISCEQATECCGFLCDPVREAGEGQSQAYAIHNVEILACSFGLGTRRGMTISPFLSHMICPKSLWFLDRSCSRSSCKNRQLFLRKESIETTLVSLWRAAGSSAGEVSATPLEASCCFGDPTSGKEGGGAVSKPFLGTVCSRGDSVVADMASVASSSTANFNSNPTDGSKKRVT